MKTYHNDPTLKETFVRRMKEHIRRDQVIQREGFFRGRGCAVGCTYDEYDHSLGPKRLGFPEWYEKLRDDIFEGIPKAEAPQFALDSLEAVPVGVDLELVRVPFLIDTLRRCPAHAGTSTDAVQRVIAWLEAGQPENKREGVRAASEAARAATRAAEAAEAAATREAAAAWAATWAATRAAEAAAWAAAEAAASEAAEAAEAAWAASEAAAAAAWAARAAACAPVPSPPRIIERQLQRDTLLNLIRNLKC